MKKSRALQGDFAAAFQADAIASVNGLPGSADEFLSALLGADVRRSLEIFQKIRADADLDTLQKDVDKILAKTIANVATKWIGRALDQANLKPFQDIVGKIVDEYRGVDQRLVNTVVHLYQDNVDQGTVDRMTAALRKIIALNGREDLAKLEDADAWQLLTRLGGNLTTLLSDDGALGEVKKVAQTALDFAEGRWQPQLRDLVNELKAQFHLDQVFDQLAGFATKDGLLRLTDVTLQGVVERLLGMAWEKIKTSDIGKAAAQLKAALDRVDEFKETWYAKLSQALHQQFSLTANYAFTRAAANDALIDVEIDVSTPAGQKLFDTAARGQFADVFDPANARLLRVHQGVLTHQLTDSAHILINVLQWSETQLVEVIARTTNSIEVQPTGLVNVFTTEASVKQRVERKDYQLESTFLIGLAGDATQAAATTTRGTQDYLIETLRKIGVSYNLAVSDKVTSTGELTQYLELAEYLRLIPSASALAATLATEFPKGLGAVTATYVAKYDSDAILAAFSQTSSAPLKDIVRLASRYLVSAHLINSSNPLSDLVTMGFAYRDPGKRGAVRPAGVHRIPRRERDGHHSGVVHEGRAAPGTVGIRRLHPPAAHHAVWTRTRHRRHARQARRDDRHGAQPPRGGRRGRSRDGRQEIRRHGRRDQHVRHDQHVLRDLRRFRAAERRGARGLDPHPPNHAGRQPGGRDEVT